MDLGNMRLQEGILLEKTQFGIGVTGIAEGVGTSFVTRQLDFLLNKKEARKVFVRSPEKYRVTDEPEEPELQDILVAVMDPLPSKLMEGADRIREILGYAVPVVWLVNRDNPGVNRKAMKKYLRFIPQFFQSEVPREIITRAEYNCMDLGEIYRPEGLEKLADYIKRQFSGSGYAADNDKDTLYGIGADL